MIWEVQRLPQQKQRPGQGISSRAHLQILGPLEATRQTWKSGLESWQPLLGEVGSGGEREILPQAGRVQEKLPKRSLEGKKMDQIGFGVVGFGKGKVELGPK